MANLMLAAAERGFEPTLEVLPDPCEADLLARVALRRRGTSTVAAPGGTGSAGGELTAAIPARRTHRGRFAAGPPAATLAAMTSACEELDVELQILTTEERIDVAGLVAEGDRALFAAYAWRRELAGWLRPRHRRDGLTVPPVLGR